MRSEGNGERWEFDYAPIPIGGGDDGGPVCDLVLATSDDVDPAHVVALLAGIVPDVAVTPLFSGHPIFWTRIESSRPIDRRTFAHRLTESGVRVRYLTSTRKGSQRLAPPTDWSHSRPRRASEWRARLTTNGSEPDTPWRWFLRGEGANVARNACGTGAGTRLAIIDNDARDLENIDADAEIMVGVSTIPRAASHAALLLGWAVGARKLDGSKFRGIAPDASPRLYCIPKVSEDVVSLPLAVLRAVDDGADVVVCATYVEGLTSPLLDDALQFATKLGRDGRGTAVVFPTGREMSSPADSIHSSLSLGMADPASDPRVFCVGPSARDGGWFLWRDRRGKLRPFANRGPAVRCLAPGDDMANPFTSDDRPGHAESSGAAAIAAGVLLLAVSSNPELELSELDALLSETSTPMDPARQGGDGELANRRDLLPLANDPDGHNAKHGYGRVNATDVCLAARDPVALVLIRIGEHDAAVRYMDAMVAAGSNAPYDPPVARWAARMVLHDARLGHSLAAALRAVRLACSHPERAMSQPPGHLLRQVGLIVRMLLESGPTLLVGSELSELDRHVRGVLDAGTAGEAEAQVLTMFAAAFDRKGRCDSPPAVTSSNIWHASGTRALPSETRLAVAPVRRPFGAASSRSRGP